MTDIQKTLTKIRQHYEKSYGLEDNDGRIIITETGAKFIDLDIKYFPTTVGKDHPNLKYLKIINCGITYVDSQFKKIFTKLKNLDLTGNNLTTIPSLNSNLKYLRLNNNNITSLPSLPSALLKLYVNNNKLTSLNLNVNNKIIELFIGGNYIAQEPTNLNISNLILTDIPKKNYYE